MEGIEISIEREKKEKEYGEFDKWEVENALRTLKEAEVIKLNPELMKAVQMCAKKEAKAINSVAGLKAKGKQMAKEESMEEDY